MDFAPEEKDFTHSVVPALFGRKQALLVPGIDAPREFSQVGVAVVKQLRSLDKHGVREHIHVLREGEQLYLGFVLAVYALDNLPCVVAHCTAVHKNGHGILGVVVKVAGAEHISLLVFQLDEGSPELGKVFIYEICELVAGKAGVVLDYADVPDTVDNRRIHVPECSVAEEISVVVQKARRPRYLAVILAVAFNLLHLPGAYQANKRVAFLLVLRLRPEEAQPQHRNP